MDRQVESQYLNPHMIWISLSQFICDGQMAVSVPFPHITVPDSHRHHFGSFPEPVLISIFAGSSSPSTPGEQQSTAIVNLKGFTAPAGLQIKTMIWPSGRISDPNQSFPGVRLRRRGSCSDLCSDDMHILEIFN